MFLPVLPQVEHEMPVVRRRSVDGVVEVVWKEAREAKAVMIDRKQPGASDLFGLTRSDDDGEHFSPAADLLPTKPQTRRTDKTATGRIPLRELVDDSISPLRGGTNSRGL
jgi:hypothetical protein